MPATITVPTTRDRITCQVWEAPEGWISYQQQREGEVLQSRGVDGTRLRVVRFDYPIFDVQIAAGASSFLAALGLRNRVQFLKYRPITISLTGGNVVASAKNVLVHDVLDCRASPGQMVADQLYNAHVTATLRLQLTEAAS